MSVTLTQRLVTLGFSLILGTAYIVLTLPRGLGQLGQVRGSELLVMLSARGVSVNAWLSTALPAFPDLMRYILYVTAAYLGSTLLLSLKHGRFELFGWALFVLSVSTAIFHLVAWIGFVAVKILIFVAWALRGIVGFLGRIFTFVLQLIFDGLAALFQWLYQWLLELLGPRWWVGAIVLLALAVFLVVKFRLDALAAVKRTIQVLFFGALVAGAVVLLRLLWLLIGPAVMWLVRGIGMVFLFIFKLLAYVLVTLGIGLAIATVGQLLLDQFKGALHAGKGRFGIIIGAIAIGTSAAILLLVGDVYGFNAWFPAAMSVFVADHLHQAAPILDAVIALLIVSLSVVGVLRNLPRLGDEPSAEEFGKSMVYAVVGVLVSGALIAIGGETEQ